jgi:hypothetical protein
MNEKLSQVSVQSIIQTKYKDEAHYNDDDARKELSTVSCECGNTKLLVNWIPGPWCGGFLKVTCDECKASRVLFDDYS